MAYIPEVLQFTEAQQRTLIETLERERGDRSQQEYSMELGIVQGVYSQIINSQYMPKIELTAIRLIHTRPALTALFLPPDIAKTIVESLCKYHGSPVQITEHEDGSWRVAIAHSQK